MSDVEPTDLTVHILREIRDDVRSLRDGMKAQREEMKSQRADFVERFELIESTLVGTNEHLLIMSRALRALLSHRGDTDNRLEDHEARLRKLEKRKPH